MMSLPALSVTKVSVFDVEQLIEKPPASSNIEAEELARRVAMERVILKATGDEASLNNEMIKKGIRQNQRYISQMSYADNTKKPTLKLSFSPQQIQALLSQAQIPYWPPERENLLVWIVEETGYERNVLWVHSSQQAIGELSRFSNQRGLPVILPTGDMQEVVEVKSSALWGDFRQDIAQASARYTSADAVLVVKLQGESQRNIRWTLYDDKPKYIAEAGVVATTGEISGSLSQVMEQLVEQLGLYYAQKRATKVNTTTAKDALQVYAQFEEVMDAKAFFKLETAINQLSSVASVELDEVKADKVRFKINLLTNAEDFNRQILRIAQVEVLDTHSLSEPTESYEGDSAENSNSFIYDNEQTLYYLWRN